MFTEVIDFATLVRFQARLRKFHGFAGQDSPRVGCCLLHQRALYRLVVVFVRVQKTVHPPQDKRHQQATDYQCEQEKQNRFGRKIFALKLRFRLCPSM